MTLLKNQFKTRKNVTKIITDFVNCHNPKEFWKPVTKCLPKIDSLTKSASKNLEKFYKDILIFNQIPMYIMVFLTDHFLTLEQVLDILTSVRITKPQAQILFLMKLTNF